MSKKPYIIADDVILPCGCMIGVVLALLAATNHSWIGHIIRKLLGY
ncbi:MAG: hypothetical protein M1133_02470 [Armatimonadetes bacterium]|nr:hypothetical protein [Armatimonadota bacterium]